VNFVDSHELCVMFMGFVWQSLFVYDVHEFCLAVIICV